MSKITLILLQQEPAWMTLLAVVFFFIIFFAFILPAELAKKRKEDQSYANRKGITVEQLEALRAKARGRKIPNSTRKYVMERDNYQCVFCGAADNLAIDHIFPFSRGGGNEPENLQVLCQPCNGAKGASVPKEFRDNT